MSTVIEGKTGNGAAVLVWCGVLHAFTHSFHVVLMPLYLAIQQDLGLASVAETTLLMTALMMAYFLPSYHLGVVADRYDRRWLLGGGLVCNGIGFVALGLAPSYGWALLAVVVAGFGGGCYHPAATSLIAQSYPNEQGKAFGLVGIGANVGFLFVPAYAGWRLDRGVLEQGVAAWRWPVVELGGLAIMVALVFLVATRHWQVSRRSQDSHHAEAPLFGSRKRWLLFIGAAVALSLRDFAGMGMGSLGALFLPQAHGYNSAATGLALSAIFLAAIISNPLFGRLSDRHRYGWMTFVMTTAGLVVFAFPFLPAWGLVPGLMTYGFFFMAGYPMVEAALMESIPAAVRGRVFGLFILISGCLGNLSHWVIGRWVGTLGTQAVEVEAYRAPYLGLALLIWGSMIGLVCLWVLRSEQRKELLARAERLGR